VLDVIKKGPGIYSAITDCQSLLAKSDIASSFCANQKRFSDCRVYNQARVDTNTVTTYSW